MRTLFARAGKAGRGVELLLDAISISLNYGSSNLLNWFWKTRCGLALRHNMCRWNDMLRFFYIFSR